MKIRVLSFALCLFLALFCTVDLFSQGESMSGKSNPLEFVSQKKPLFFGITGGVNQALHSADISTFAADEYCPKFASTTGLGFFGGVFVWIPLGNFVTSEHSIFVKATYNTLSADFTADGATYEALTYPVGQSKADIVNFTTEHTLEATYHVLAFELLYRYKIVDNLGLAVGPTFDIPFKKTSVQKLSIIDPDNLAFQEPEAIPEGYTYSSDHRTIFINNGDIPDASSFRFGLKMGINYEWVTGSGFDVIPFVFYNYGITKVTSSEDWRISSFQLGVDVRFKIMHTMW